MFLAQEQQLLVEHGPVPRVLADGDDGNDEPAGGGEVGGLPRLLLERQKLVERRLRLAR